MKAEDLSESEELLYDESIIPAYLKQQVRLENLVFNPTIESMNEAKSIIPSLSKHDVDALSRMIIHSALLNRFDFVILSQLFSCLSPNCQFFNTVFSEYLVLKGIISPHQLFEEIKERKDLKTIENPFLDQTIESYIINDDLDKFVYSSCDQTNFYNKSTKLDSNEITLIDLAAKSGASKCFKYIMINGANITGNTAKFAVQSGNFDIIELCQQYDCDFSQCLETAIEAHRTEIVQWILSNFSPEPVKLHFCIQCFNTLAFVYYVELGVDINEKNEELDTVIHFLSYFGEYEQIWYLIDKHVDVNLKDERDLTPLHIVSNQGYIEIVKILVENGAEIDSRGQNGKTALHLASSNGHLDVVKYLVEKGANINCLTFNWRQTPVLMAAANDNIDIVEYLIKKGANVNAQNSFGETLYHIAVLNGNIDLLKILHDNNVNIEQINNEGRTPLIEASKQGKLEIVKKLIEYGANKEATDKKGNNALKYAKKEEIKKILL